MTRIEEVFCLNLRVERNKKAITQEKLAENCEISLNHLQALESGRRLPSLGILQRLSDALDVEPYRFLLDPESSEEIQEAVLSERLANEVKLRIDDFVKGAKKSKE